MSFGNLGIWEFCRSWRWNQPSYETLSHWERYLTRHSVFVIASNDPEFMNMLHRPARMIQSPIIQILPRWPRCEWMKRKLAPCPPSPKTVVCGKGERFSWGISCCCQRKFYSMWGSSRQWSTFRVTKDDHALTSKRPLDEMIPAIPIDAL